MSLEDPRIQRLKQMVAECVAALDCSIRPISLFYDGPKARARYPVTFYDRDLETPSSLSDRVLEETTKTLKHAQRDLVARDADPRFGFQVNGIKDLSRTEGWDGEMPRWMVVLVWVGPRPMFWPHKATAKDAAMPKDEDLPSDYDFMLKYGERPEAMMRRLSGRRK